MQGSQGIQVSNGCTVFPCNEIHNVDYPKEISCHNFVSSLHTSRINETVYVEIEYKSAKLNFKYAPLTAKTERCGEVTFFS